ncbi:MAG: FtsX-like permease family protein [Luteitalea sp.]|nr:FtsX-like permease family protein [Luteitalea sp.]
MTAFWRKLNGWWRRDAIDAELQEEIRTHLEMKAADLGGPSPARHGFGNPALILEDARSVWGWPGLEALWHDVRYGTRMLLKAPGFTAVAVLSLAIGIGANTAIFSLVDKVLIRKLPVPEPDRLVVVSANRGQGVATTSNFPDFVDYRDKNEVFDGLVAYTQRAMTLSEGGQAERIQGLIVSGNYFTALRLRPALGRGFLPEEDKTASTHPVVVIGYGLWQRRFGGDPGIVGKSVSLNARPFTVVGVAPSAFNGTVAGGAPDVYVPIMMMMQMTTSPIDLLFGPRSRTLSGWLQVLGRLKPGVSREQAAAAMTTLGGQIARAYPNADGSPRVEPTFLIEDGSRGHTNLLRDLRFPLQMLMATVGLILLIACANVANLLLARAGARQKEIAIRLATGAGRMRLIRQLLSESVLLSMLGGAAGLALAVSISGLMVSFTPPNNNAFSSLTLDNRLDVRVLGFTLAISMVTGILFGLAPALIASRPDLVSALRDEATVFGKKVRHMNLRNLLVVGQVAVSVIVLVGAGLCVRSLRNLNAIDAGFDPSKVLVMSVDVSLSGYNRERGLQFYSDLLERVQRLPGVEAVSLAIQIALGDGFGARMRAEGYVPKPGEDLSADFNQIGPDYFRVMKIPLLEGREFGQSDTSTTLPVAVINQTAARRFWPGQSPLGRRVIVGRPPDDESRVVVGVVKDSKYRRLTEEVRPAVFIPFFQRYRGDMTLHVRTTGDPATMLAAVRREVQALDASLPLYNTRTLEEQKTSSLYTSRLAATLLTIFGLLALVLAAVGLYGVMAYTVSRRTHEIGIRMALGAQGSDVRRLVMVEGTAIMTIGLLLGLGGALAGTRLVESFLYGVRPNDPIAFAGAALLLAAVTLLANYLPARRASRTDPLMAIRQ